MGRAIASTRFGHMHATSTGEGDPPLVLLHMSPLSGTQFAPGLAALSRDRRVIAPDRIGFGHSDRPAEPLSLVEHAEATLECLHELGVEQFDVYGAHSGSVEAIELAVAHPERVRRVAVEGLVVYEEADERSFRTRYVPPPAPGEDGSHLDWYWGWWTRLRLPEWDAAFMQSRAFEHIDSSPDFWRTYIAVIDHPHREQIPKVRQPFLVLAPGDHLHEQTLAARDLLPPQAELVDLGHLVCDETFAYHAEPVIELLESFFGAAA